jgi:hypothetical protein
MDDMDREAMKELSRELRVIISRIKALDEIKKKLHIPEIPEGPASPFKGVVIDPVEEGFKCKWCSRRAVILVTVDQREIYAQVPLCSECVSMIAEWA